MISRRTFLGSVSAPALLAAASRGPVVPKQIKSFCIDFNWRRPRVAGWINDFAPPGHWADASPAEHVAWYQEMGANVIQTFAVSCNGYAWYKGGFVPPQPGLKYDFLPEVVERGHSAGMMVVGYFCAAANTKWGLENKELSYGAPSAQHIPFTDEYLDYLSHSIEDALRRTGMDGFMIDWVWTPAPRVRESGWLEAERRLLEKLTRKRFPANGEPDAELMLAYERASIERCWTRIRKAAKGVNRQAVIWLACSNLTDRRIANSRMLRELDWILNEAPNPDYFEAGRRMAGRHTRMIQCLVGWGPKHNAQEFLADPKNQNLDLYGFAEPRDNSLPLPAEVYLHRPISSFEGADVHTANDRNIAALARFYRGLPLT